MISHILSIKTFIWAFEEKNLDLTPSFIDTEKKILIKISPELKL